MFLQARQFLRSDPRLGSWGSFFASSNSMLSTRVIPISSVGPSCRMGPVTDL